MSYNGCVAVVLGLARSAARAGGTPRLIGRRAELRAPTRPRPCWRDSSLTERPAVVVDAVDGALTFSGPDTPVERQDPTP